MHGISKESNRQKAPNGFGKGVVSAFKAQHID